MVGPVEHDEEILQPGFRVRDVRPGDRAEILDMTAHTWAFGDYIEWVFDDWLAATTRRLLTAVHIDSGRLAAIDKLTFLSPQEAWFEGLRVAPDFRGQGLAARLQSYMIGEVRRAEARTIRLLTSLSNAPVQRIAYRDGFALRSVVSFWKWNAPGRQPSNAIDLPLRRASVEEAPALFDWWVRSAAYKTAGLCHRNWSFSETNRAEWQRAATNGLLLVAGEPAEWHLPPASVLLSEKARPDGGTLWIITAASGQGTAWNDMLASLINNAHSDSIDEINGLFPQDRDAESALRAAGFYPDVDDEPLCLFV